MAITITAPWWLLATAVAWFTYLILREGYKSRRGTLVCDGTYIIHKKQYPDKWSKDTQVCRKEHYIPDILARAQTGYNNG